MELPEKFYGSVRTGLPSVQLQTRKRGSGIQLFDQRAGQFGDLLPRGDRPDPQTRQDLPRPVRGFAALGDPGIDETFGVIRRRVQQVHRARSTSKANRYVGPTRLMPSRPPRIPVNPTASGVWSTCMPARRVPGAGPVVAPSEAVAPREAVVPPREAVVPPRDAVVPLHLSADCGAWAAAGVARESITARQTMGFMARRFGEDEAPVKVTLAGVSEGHYVQVTLALGRFGTHPPTFAWAASSPPAVGFSFVLRHDTIALRSS